MSSERTKEYRILLVGGGTGGHFYPLIAIAEALNKYAEQPRLYYAGPDPYDAPALLTEHITFIKIPAGKQRKYRSIHNYIDTVKVFLGLCVALVKLFSLYPDVIVSKGGYTSVPIILIAAFLRIPIVVHESDAVIGRANKIGARFAQYLVITYAETKIPKTKAEIFALGIPMRRSLLSAPTSDAASRLCLTGTKPVVLILGGSQGAERVNQLILDSLDNLLPDFEIIHQTGPKLFDVAKLAADNLVQNESVRNLYHPTPFLSSVDLNNAYHLASIVISRAGSTSIYEIALHHKPSILIPIPEEISHDQRTNAYAYARTGAASVIEEGNLRGGLLRAEIDRIMQDSALYESMANAASTFAKGDAADTLAELVMSIAKQH